MAEIKSTLDLIMEITRNLSMTPEEKEALRRKEWHSRIQGWLQRYLDGLMGTNSLKEAILDLQEPERSLCQSLLRDEARLRLQPEGDNERLLELIQHVLGEDTMPLKRAIASFQRDMRRQAEEHIKNGLISLSQQGIRGSAVMPNLDRDPSWERWLGDAREGFRKTALA
jgi:hypothetical protein